MALQGTFAPTLILLTSLAVFTLATILGPGERIEPFFSWYYLFAWWPFILAGESVLARRNASLLLSRPKRFLLLLPLSLIVWLFFEAFNFRLQNWHYLNLPSSTSLRWIGYSLSFATVIPGLLVTKTLLQELGLGRFSPSRPLPWLPRFIPWLFLTGALFLLLPLLWPRYFFPLVWGGVFLLVDPFLYRRGEPSFLGQIAQGHWRQLFLWLYAGAVCGLLWELWNYWAGARWSYTVPFVGDLKLFEMPLLGFLGFPPFALECAVLITLFFRVKDRISRQAPMVSAMLWTLLIAGAALFSILVFSGIDRMTVESFRSDAL
jgi:hypothetical protein